jgi:hypothetical protein
MKDLNKNTDDRYDSSRQGMIIYRPRTDKVTIEEPTTSRFSAQQATTRSFLLLYTSFYY